MHFEDGQGKHACDYWDTNLKKVLEMNIPLIFLLYAIPKLPYNYTKPFTILYHFYFFKPLIKIRSNPCRIRSMVSPEFFR